MPAELHPIAETTGQRIAAAGRAGRLLHSEPSAAKFVRGGLRQSGALESELFFQLVQMWLVSGLALLMAGALAACSSGGEKADPAANAGAEGSNDEAHVLDDRPS